MFPLCKIKQIDQSQGEKMINVHALSTRIWWALIVTVSLILVSCSPLIRPPAEEAPPSPGLAFVDYRHLNGGADGVALIDLDPDSPDFGKIIQQVEMGQGVLPHHLYFNRDQSKLYNTTLGGERLYEVGLQKDAAGFPTITKITPIDVGDNYVGEDMYFTQDGSRFYMTFMAGKGADRDGSIGVFDAKTNELLEVIHAPEAADPASDQPFILYPHGISANEELGLLMVTSTQHPEEKGAGNTVTTIDLQTNQPIKTQLVADSKEDISVPVEVMMLRDGLPPFALASTTLGGDIWIAAYNASAKSFDDFVKVIDGEKEGLGVALEFYIHTSHAGQKELYVSFGVPGVINVYALDALPQLPLKRTLPAGAGAHHMTFFETRLGREVVVIQNNLLNIEGLNAGTLMVVDIHTGETLKTLDMKSDYGLMPESIEAAFGHGHDLHH
jgi:DNA-binding beta-propeller fold protein YncE